MEKKEGKKFWNILVVAVIAVIILIFLLRPSADVSEEEDDLEEPLVQDELPDETETEIIVSCSDECSAAECDGYDYVDCVIGSDGCKDIVVEGTVIGECNVQCLSDSDCASDQGCASNKKCVDIPSETDSGDGTESMEELLLRKKKEKEQESS
jgi:hypothetical protein